MRKVCSLLHLHSERFRGLADEHSLLWDVSSVEGRGTQFTLYFPVTLEKPMTDEIEVPLVVYRGRGEKILVVDDDPDQQDGDARFQELRKEN